VLDLLDLGVVILDEELNIHSWNKWLEIYTELSKESVYLKRIDEVFPEINLKVFKRKVSTTLSLGTQTYYYADISKPFIKIPNKRLINSKFKFLRLSIMPSIFHTVNTQILFPKKLQFL